MTTVARRNPQDSAKIKAIEEKLLANPEMAKLIDELGTSTTDANDLVRGLLQASINRGLNAEMDAHLGYQHGDRDSKEAAGQNNSRNGSYPKRVDSNYGPIDVAVPRDRNGSFLPTMVPKGSRRLTDVDDMIISLYAGGMTIRDIQHHMATAMGVDISHETISAITDAVLEEVMIWQNRQLDEFYPVIFLDALRIKVRDGGRVVNKSALTWLSGWIWRESNTSWVSGWPKRKEPRSGPRCVPTSLPAECTMCSSCAVTGSRAYRRRWKRPGRIRWCRPVSCI